MAKDPREYGFEGEMVMSQLKGIMNHAEQMHNMLKPDTDLPEWVQSKVTLAYDYMQTAADYMATEMNEAIDKGLEDELMSQRQGQSGKNWRVTRANKTIGTYNSKDKADVKAMKHPLNKVVANEETQIDELSKDTLKSYVNKADARTMDRVIDNPKARRKAQNRTFGIEKAVKKIQEDGAVNAAGAGNVAGLGVGSQGEPGVHMKKRKKTVIARFKRFVRT
jgi:hypothetical protein